MTAKVYALHAGDGIYRYVGVTFRTLSERLYDHEHHAHQQLLPVMNWIGAQTKVLIELLEEVDDELAYKQETYWIAKLRDAGADLLNVTNGGLGASGFRHSEEFKQRLSRERTGAGNPMYGRVGFSRPRTLEERRKLSASHPNKVLTEDLVIEIRLRGSRGQGAKQISQELSLPYTATYKALTGITWSHI